MVDALDDLRPGMDGLEAPAFSQQFCGEETAAASMAPAALPQAASDMDLFGFGSSLDGFRLPVSNAVCLLTAEETPVPSIRGLDEDFGSTSFKAASQAKVEDKLQASCSTIVTQPDLDMDLKNSPPCSLIGISSLIGMTDSPSAKAPRSKTASKRSGTNGKRPGRKPNRAAPEDKWLDASKPVDARIAHIETLVGSPDEECVQRAYAVRLGRADRITEVRKIEERGKLRDVPSGPGKPNERASRIEAKLSRFRKNEYITTLQDELKAATRDICVLQRAVALHPPPDDSGTLHDVQADGQRADGGDRKRMRLE